MTTPDATAYTMTKLAETAVNGHTIALWRLDGPSGTVWSVNTDCSEDDPTAGSSSAWDGYANGIQDYLDAIGDEIKEEAG